MGVVEQIRQGTLDFVLLKPADTQFLVSTTRFEPWKIVDVLAGAGIMAWAFHLLGQAPTAAGAALSLALFACSLIVLYSLWILVVSAAFWVVRLDNLAFLFTSVLDFARWPVTFFRPAWRLFFSVVVPIGLMTTYPAQALLGWVSPETGGLGARTAALAALGSVAFAGGARWVWTRAIATYTSASSPDRAMGETPIPPLKADPRCHLGNASQAGRARPVTLAHARPETMAKRRPAAWHGSGNRTGMGFDGFARRSAPIAVCMMIALAAYFQAAGLMRLVGGILAPASIVAPFRAPAFVLPPAAASERDLHATSILESNPFDHLNRRLIDLPKDHAGGEASDADAPGTDWYRDPPCDVARVVLIVSSEDPAWSFAAITGPDGKTALRRRGEDFFGGKVTFVGDQRPTPHPDDEIRGALGPVWAHGPERHALPAPARRQAPGPGRPWRLRPHPPAACPRISRARSASAASTSSRSTGPPSTRCSPTPPS